MSDNFEVPHLVGQLVWCPSDPSQGIGLVTGVDGTVVRVRFLRLQEERAYTTRSSDLVILRYSIAAGERVRHRDGRVLTVASRLPGARDGLAVYAVEDDGGEVVESDLVPEVRDVGAKERLAALNLVHPETVRARLGGVRLSQFGRRPGYSALLGARVQWLPHQIDVATRAVRQDPVRLLLADEVGLGKTVEAALIYAGLRQEGRAGRVLILTPDALCIQWLGEIFRKAHELLVLLDGPRLEDALRDFPDMNPFEAHQRVVASIERLAPDPSLAMLAADADWDLVIVDEAHHLRWKEQDGGNDAYRLVESLAQRARHLLLLTATPMALDPAEYHALLRLLDPARFDDPAAFDKIRTRARSIREVAQSVAALAHGSNTELSKQTTEQAYALLSDDDDDAAELTALVSGDADETRRGELVRNVLDALRYRHGLADYVVRNRRGPVGGLPQRHAETFVLEPSELQEALIEVGESIIFDLVGTMDDPDERKRAVGRMLRALWATPRALLDIVAPYSPSLVEELTPHVEAVLNAPLDGAGLPTGDTRLCWLVKLIRSLEPGEKLLVFVESPVAVRGLRGSLEGLLAGQLAVFHRELAPRDQDRQVAWFRDPSGPQVMLSTEAGGEGRNFQFCHQVVLYDMPWRPATVEQRIGRVDRVGQKHNVKVFVPCFRLGYEAAVLKIMQESIGVLDRTVGGIDHSLEYVSDRIAELVLAGADADAWNALFDDTRSMVDRAWERIAAGVDPILDHASFSKERAAVVLASVPDDLEARTEAFVQRFAAHSKIKLHSASSGLVTVEGGPSAAGRQHGEGGFSATFSRTYGLDHEEVEFLSFGHPLVQQALEWAHTDSEATAALALCRGFSQDGAAFVWCFALDLPDDVPAIGTYFDSPLFIFALDEEGKRVPELEGLLDGERRLERMDPKPLRPNIKRWKRLVEQNHGAAEALAKDAVETTRRQALARLDEVMQRRHRDLLRSQTRELAQLPDDTDTAVVMRRHREGEASLLKEEERLRTAIDHTRPHLFAAVAVRLMRAKHVSA